MSSIGGEVKSVFNHGKAFKHKEQKISSISEEEGLVDAEKKFRVSKSHISFEL